MWKVSEKFNQAFASDYREIFVRIKINDQVYRNDNLTSVEYEGGSIVGETFSVGSTYSNSLKVVFCEIVEGLKELDEVRLDIGIKYTKKCDCRVENGTRICLCKSNDCIELLCGCETTDSCNCTWVAGESYCDVIEYCPMGIFLISETVDIDWNENKTTIECMDRMILLEGEYESKLSYPAPIREVALEIANLAGIEVNQTSFARLSSNVIQKPEGYSFRQAIGLIAQFEAGFVTFDREGILDIRVLDNIDFRITPEEYFSKGLVKNDLRYTLGGIQAIIRNELDNNTLQVGLTNGAQIVLENNVMTQSLLQNIYEQLRNLNFFPFTLNWRGNPALEAGDWIEMVDREGNLFKSPNLTYRLSFSGGLYATSSADTQSQALNTFQRRPALDQVLDWVNGVIGKNGNATFFGTATPQSPREGDIWFKPNGPYTEIWVFNNEQWLLELSSAMSDEVKQAIDNAQKSAEAAQNTADDGLKKAEDAIAQSEINATSINGLRLIVDGKVSITEFTILENLVQTKVSDHDFRLTITQLSDQINLRVEKENIISQINISPESILISGEKVHITGQTWIEEGIIKTAHIGEGAITNAKIANASITSAKIVNVSAEQIVAGTMQGMVIRGGTFETTGNSRHIVLQNGEINSFSSGIRRMELTGTDLNFYRSGGNILGMKLNSFGLDFTSDTGAALGTVGAVRNTVSGQWRMSLYATRTSAITLGAQRVIDDLYDPLLIVHGGTDRRIEQTETYYNNHRIRQANLTRCRATEEFTIGSNTTVNFWSHVNMNGWQIQNQSDVRLKKNIQPTSVNGIKETKKIKMIDFEWKNDYRPSLTRPIEELDYQSSPEENAQKKVITTHHPLGLQFGLMAQSTDFLSELDPTGDTHYLVVNQNKQINLNTKTNQELIQMVEIHEQRIKTLEAIIKGS